YDLAEPHLRLDERLLCRSQIQKFSDSSESPSCALELFSTHFVHDLSTSLNAARRRRHCVSTSSGVFRVFFEKMSRIAIAPESRIYAGFGMSARGYRKMAENLPNRRQILSDRVLRPPTPP